MLHQEPEFTRVIDLPTGPDVTYPHLEMNLDDYEGLRWSARDQGIGSFMMADPEIVVDLKSVSIDIV